MAQSLFTIIEANSSTLRDLPAAIISTFRARLSMTEPLRRYSRMRQSAGLILALLTLALPKQLPASTRTSSLTRPLAPFI